MNNTHLDQARAWARDNIDDFYEGQRVYAACEVIQSLPDTVVDGDKLREVINKVLANTVHGTVGHQVAEDYAALIGELIPAPPLPTLADLIEAGNDPQKYQWMKAKIHRSDDLEGVIFFLTDDRAKIMFRDGTFVTQDHEDITPLPDLPRLKWPGSHADTITAESVEDVQAGRVADFEPALPRPEDVPAGEPWIVMCGGRTWVGVRADGQGQIPWGIIRTDGMDYQDVADSEITLVSRLVPEGKP